MFTSDESLRVVRMVAKYQSITQAAEKLHKVPSAVSYTVKKLEETFGAKLFMRKGCYIQLTSAGEYFIHHSKAILDDLEALKRNVAIVDAGVENEVRVAVNNIVPQGALIDFVEAFEQTFPSSQLTLSQEVYNGCWDALYQGRADMVIGAPHAVPSADGVVSRPLGHMEWDFVVGAAHPLANAEHVLESSELRRYPAVCIRDTSVNLQGMQAWLLEGQKPIFVSDFSTAIALIARNVAIGCIPRHMYLAHRGIALVRKSIEERKHATRLFLAYRSGGMGKARRWSLDYLGGSARSELLCGNAPGVCH
jgi:DNA-binding transcriptional LysR family regulator